MLRFNANVTSMYPELKLTEAIGAAKADGFDAIECRSPFEEPKEHVAEALAQHGVTMVQFNTPMGDVAAGERGIACIPGKSEAFRDTIALTLDYARTIRPLQINCPGGVAAPDATRDSQKALLAENLTWAAERFATQGMRLQLEGINPLDNKGILIGSAADAMQIIEMAKHDNIWLQYDFYHQQVTDGDLVRTFQKFQARTNHVQFADLPGRHEPGTGEINYAFVMQELDRLGYDGWVGLEYGPIGKVADSLEWMHAYRGAAN